MPTTDVRVLLLGQRATGFSRIRRRLEQQGCRCWLAASPDVGLALCQQHDVHFILSASPVNQTNALVAHLCGAKCSAYCAYPVRDSCLWLPLLDRGRPCFGAPFLRPNELWAVLNDRIAEIQADQIASIALVPVPARRANREDTIASRAVNE
jgi:hypothetical protein